MNNTNIYSNFSCSYYSCGRIFSFILLSPLTLDFWPFHLKSNFWRVVKMYILFCFYCFFPPTFPWNYLVQCLFFVLVIQAETRNNTFPGSWYWNLAALASTTEPSGKINFTVTVRGEVFSIVKHISRPSTGLHERDLGWTLVAKANVRFKLRISLNRKRADKNSPKELFNKRETTNFCVEVMNNRRQVNGKLGYLPVLHFVFSVCCKCDYVLEALR